MDSIYDILTSSPEVATVFLIVVGLLVIWAVLYRRRTAEVATVTHWVWYRPFQRVSAQPGPAGTTTNQAADPTQAPPAPGPTIGITPNSGPQQGGQKVTLIGTGFCQDARLDLGEQRATAVRVNRAGTRLTARTPARDSGPVDVTITNPDGLTASLPQGYNYN
ncbi:MAG: IPT/TIG domain-containing protein [bacterium]|nr:IPT/TIG domain-containing protein [bacterium]